MHNILAQAFSFSRMIDIDHGIVATATYQLLHIHGESSIFIFYRKYWGGTLYNVFVIVSTWYRTSNRTPTFISARPDIGTEISSAPVSILTINSVSTGNNVRVSTGNNVRGVSTGNNVRVCTGCNVHVVSTGCNVHVVSTGCNVHG